jgi:hypothetical protein
MLQVRRLKAVDEGRKLKFAVRQSGPSIFESISRVSAACWAKTSVPEEMLLYATINTSHLLESKVTLRHILSGKRWVKKACVIIY